VEEDLLALHQIIHLASFYSIISIPNDRILVKVFYDAGEAFEVVYLLLNTI